MTINPSFPIGKFVYARPPDKEQREKFIEDMSRLRPRCGRRCRGFPNSLKRLIARADGRCGR